MPRRKTHIYAYGYMQWLYDSFQRQLLKLLNSYPNATLPPDPFQAFHLVNLSLLAPAVFEEDSVEGDRLRHHLTQLVSHHPEFVGITLLFLRRPAQTSPSARVREFLLTERILSLPSGCRVEMTDALDKEIAAAVGVRYQLKSVSAKMVAHERKRLQKFGAVKSQHDAAILKLVNSHWWA